MLTSLLLITGSILYQQSNVDSLGVEKIEGNLFIMHRVETEQTLYRISKKYDVPVTEILKYNEEVKSGIIHVGQLIKIPYSPVPRPASNRNYHIVRSGETLYAISKKYKLSVERLKAINKLRSNTLEIGQKIFIASKEYPLKDTLYAQLANDNKNIIEAYEPTQTPSKVEDTKVLTSIKEEKNSDTNDPITSPENTIVEIDEKVMGVSEVKEAGYAERMKGAIANRKYLARHNHTKKGTILKIRNPSNQRETFVRVVGAITDDADDNKSIIQLSKSAFVRLGGVKTKLKVEVIYYK